MKAQIAEALQQRTVFFEMGIDFNAQGFHPGILKRVPRPLDHLVLKLVDINLDEIGHGNGAVRNRLINGVAHAALCKR